MTATDLTRRLSAIFSANVEGYSRPMREDEEATVQAITTYRTAMTHLIQQFQLLLAATYIHLGREEEARAAAAEVIRAVPHFSLEDFEKKSYMKNQDYTKQYIKALRKAGLK